MFVSLPGLTEKLWAKEHVLYSTIPRPTPYLEGTGRGHFGNGWGDGWWVVGYGGRGGDGGWIE